MRILLIILCIGVVSCSLGELPPGQQKATPIHTVKPKRTNLKRTLPFTTVVKPQHEKTLFFQSQGEIESCLKNKSGVVKKGEVLCKLSTRLLDLEIAATKQRLKAATEAANPAHLARQKSLYKNKMIAEAEYEKIKAKFSELEAGLAAINSAYQLLLEKKRLHQIISPFNGIIAKNFTTRLQVASIGTPAFHILDPNKLIADVNIHQSLFSFISKDSLVQFREAKSIRASGKILELGKVVDPITQNLTITLSLKSDYFRIGQMIDGALLLWEKPNSLTIPRSSIIRHYTSEIFTIKENRLQLTTIETGFATGGRIEVKSGVTENDVIANSNITNLAEGQQIRNLTKHD